MRATFVFPNSRDEVLAGIADGTEPDSTLYGANHLREHGIDADVHEPLLSRRRLPGPIERIAWNLRELTVPLEVGGSDVVFTPMAALLPLAGRPRRLPVVVFNYGINLIWRRASRARRRLLRASLRSAAGVVFVATSQREELVDAAGLLPSRSHLLLIPTDAEFFTPAGAGDGQTVATVGKDLSRDYQTLADAARSLDAPVELAVHKRNLKGMVLPPNARSLGLIDRIELRALYARAACVVLPQHQDDFLYGTEAGGTTALLEAMAMGKPVVATRRRMLDDYIEDGVDALVVPPKDPTALREAIEQVLGDPALAARLGAAGRARVEQAHTTRGFAAELAPVLRSVV